MNKAMDWLCEKICGHPPINTDGAGVPDEVREASHAIANTVTEIQGSTAKLHKEVNGFLALARGMQNRKGKNAR